jgi:hypothetical protein
MLCCFEYQKSSELLESSDLRDSVLVYVMYHDDESLKIAEGLKEKYEWTKLQKLGRSKYFENQIFLIMDEHYEEWKNKKYVGQISYKIVNKQLNAKFDISNIIKESNTADVVAFFKRSKLDLLTQAALYHKHFEQIWVNLLTKLGYTTSEIYQKYPIFPCNCWMAKPDWMKKYIAFVKQAMYLLDNDTELKALCSQNSNYLGSLPAETLIDIFGKPYYTYEPFIMERLPCFFFSIQGAKIYDVNVGIPQFYY